MDELQEARLQINAVDKEMAALFVKRMRAVEQVSAYKQAHGLPVLDAAREVEVVRRNAALVEDTTLQEYYVNFLRYNMQLSSQYQHRMQEGVTVAYSGVEGAFAHIASKKIFPDATLCAYGDFRAAYEAVVNGDCDCAVLPIENSYAGEVSQVIDLLFRGTLFVNGVYELEITQNLLGLAGATKKDIKTVISHPQALGQCAEYIRAHGFDRQEAENTARAAKQVAESGDLSKAAIASLDTAALYGLEVLEKNINESSNNTTRFAVFSRAMAKSESNKDKQSILVFTVKNESGALAKAVHIIGQHGFNMRTLRSRPMKTLLWNYYFYVETDGNLQTEEGKLMMQELSECCDRLRVVGTFDHEILLK